MHCPILEKICQQQEKLNCRSLPATPLLLHWTSFRIRIRMPCLWILQYVCMQKQAIMPVWLPLLYLYIFFLLVVSLFYRTHNKQYQCVDLVDYAVLLLWSWEAEYMRLSFDIQILIFALGPFSLWGHFRSEAKCLLFYYHVQSKLKYSCQYNYWNLCWVSGNNPQEISPKMHRDQVFLVLKPPTNLNCHWRSSDEASSKSIHNFLNSPMVQLRYSLPRLK